MKRIVFIVIIVLFALRAIAQIPYFAGTVGDGKLYGYTSLKGRPGLNQQETYTTFQYGLSSHVDAGIDLYTGPDNRLFWCSNTWWVRYRGGHDTY